MWLRPTKTKKISNTFAQHLKRHSKDPGVDYPVKVGTPVTAVNDGKVIKVINSITGAGGRTVLVKHGAYKADYLHLSKISCKAGQIVKAGDLLGLSGGSGLGSEKGYGPHLHFAIRRRGAFLRATGNFDYEKFMVAENAKLIPVPPVEPPTSAV
jgi:murein DD-endopeptidase